MTDMVQSLTRFFRRKTIVNSEELRAMAQSGRYREVVDSYRAGRTDASASELVGYCYYQLAAFAEAIPHLEKGIQLSPAAFYNNLFLGNALKACGRNREAVAQYLTCLKLEDVRKNEGFANNVLDQMLPLLTGLDDGAFRQQAISVCSAIIETFNSSSFLAKLLFYLGREGEFSAEAAKESSCYHFYSAKELAELGYGTYLPLGAPEKLRFVKMETKTDVWVDTKTPYVAEMKDAKVVSGSSLVFLPGDKILSDVLADKNFGQFADTQYEKIILARRKDALLVKNVVPDQEIPEAILLCGLVSDAYGHWFAEFLPKLRFLEQHPRFATVPILIDEGMPQSHYDFLTALVDNPTFRLGKGKAVKVGNLFIAPTDTFFPIDLVNGHQVPPEQQSSLTVGALKYISEKIRKRFGEPPVDPKSKIILSRRKTQWRRLIEEEAIIADLKDLGFETVYMEDHPFAKQVEIFQNASFLIAPNGSATNNLIFSNPKVKMLMLGQKNLFNWGGWFGSFMELGYSPQYLAGESLGHASQKHVDYSIPVSAVRSRVIEMLNSKNH